MLDARGTLSIIPLFVSISRTCADLAGYIAAPLLVQFPCDCNIIKKPLYLSSRKRHKYLISRQFWLFSHNFPGGFPSDEGGLHCRRPPEDNPLRLCDNLMIFVYFSLAFCMGHEL